MRKSAQTLKGLQYGGGGSQLTVKRTPINRQMMRIPVGGNTQS